MDMLTWRCIFVENVAADPSRDVVIRLSRGTVIAPYGPCEGYHDHVRAYDAAMELWKAQRGHAPLTNWFVFPDAAPGIPLGMIVVESVTQTGADSVH